MLSKLPHLHLIPHFTTHRSIHRIRVTKMFGLEKTTKTIESNLWPIITLSSRPWHCVSSCFLNTSRNSDLLPVQSVPMPYNPFREEILSDAQPELSVAPFQAISFHPVIGCLGENNNPHLTTAKVTPEPPSLYNTPSSLSHFSYDLLSRLFPSFTVLLWAHSSISMFFLKGGAQTWTQNSRCCLTSACMDTGPDSLIKLYDNWLTKP